MAFINPSSGFGGQTFTAVAGIVGINDVNNTNIRRTFVLDAFNKVAYCTTAGLTNGIAAVPQSTERQRNKTIKIGAKFDGADNFAALKVYGCKIYEEGVLVRDFRPCVIGPAQDGTIVAGLKDSLTGAFATYPNATSANRLDCGGKIDCPPYVETLRSDKRYIDTGYSVTANTKVALDYAPVVARTGDDTWYFFGASGSKRFVALINKNGFGFSNDTWNHLGIGMATEASLANVRRTIILDNPAALGVVETEGVTNISRTVDSAVGKTYGTTSLKIAAPADGNGHYATIRIYGCKVWEKEDGEYVLKRDYVPAVVNGVAGLQDILPGGEFLELLGRRVVVRIRRPKDALYRCSCLAEVLVITAFAGCLRGFVEVTGVSDVVHFLFAFGDDFTVGSAENLAPVDGTVLLYSAMDFDERVIINRFSHNSDILVKNYTLCLYDSHQ